MYFLALMVAKNRLPNFPSPLVNILVVSIMKTTSCVVKKFFNTRCDFFELTCTRTGVCLFSLSLSRYQVQLKFWKCGCLSQRGEFEICGAYSKLSAPLNFLHGYPRVAIHPLSRSMLLGPIAGDAPVHWAIIVP